MKFCNNILLYLGLVSPFIMIIVYFLIFKWKKEALNKFVSPELAEKIAASHSSKKQILKSILISAALFFIILSIARPQWGFKKAKTQRKGIDIIVALDTSLSMETEDVQPSRLEKAKHELGALIEELKGDRVGIIIFAGTSFLQCPLTTDYGAARMFLDAINTGTLPVQGTAISKAIRSAIKAFVREERKHKVLILLTDGEDHYEKPEDAAKEAKKEGIIIYTIGMGTPSGEPIPIKDQKDNITGYKKDRSGKVITSKLDELALEKIALQTGGKYFRATTQELELKEVYEEILKMEKKTFKSEQFSQYEDRYHWFLIPAFIILLFEMLLSERKNTFGWIRRKES